MKHLLFKFAIGVVLTGCVINNQLPPAPTVPQPVTIYVPTPYPIYITADPIKPEVVKSEPVSVKSDCGTYRPPVVPEPVQVDMQRLRDAGSASEINAIALQAVKVLHRQLKDYAVKEQLSFAEYTKRCLTK